MIVRNWLAPTFVALTLAANASAQDEIRAWGLNHDGQVSMAPAGLAFVQLVAGGYHSHALLADGSFVSWGSDDSGEVSMAPTGTGFTQVSAGLTHSLALRSDGSIVAWGGDFTGQVSGTPSGTGFIQVAGGDRHSLALRADGSIVSWGNDTWNQVSGTPTGTDFVMIAAGGVHSLALRSDGSIVTWGPNNPVVWNSPTESGFVDIVGAYNHSLALRSDGSIHAWGQDAFGQVSDAPTGTGFLQITGGSYHSVALHSDGSLVAWGNTSLEEIPEPPTPSGFTQIALGRRHGLALYNGNVGNGFCYGSFVPCLCGGDSHGGCLNSTALQGAKLSANGHAYLGNDSFRLEVEQLPGSNPGLILRGSQQFIGSQGHLVGDGILCTAGQTARSHVQVSSAGSTTFTDFRGSPFGAFSYGPGVPVHYQFWYRDAGNGCTGSGFNFSNAWIVTWQP